ncbi:MAG TPA: NRDE family protein [Anaeromyxobacteraceae bacterium]
MCTLAVAVGADRRWPLVVAANRDERLGRASETWALRELAGGGRAAYPLDLEAGGTWLGVAATGLLAALTNYHAPQGGFPDRSRRSRGELVPLALSRGNVAGARRALAGLDPSLHNPFHLLVLDGGGGFLLRNDGRAVALDELGPGLHVVTERDPQGRCPRGERVRARWPLDPSPARLREVLASHGEDGSEATCIHLGAAYGTRSAAILRLAPSAAHAELFAAEGPPCTAPFEDRSRLLGDLARSGGGSA